MKPLYILMYEKKYAKVLTDVNSMWEQYGFLNRKKILKIHIFVIKERGVEINNMNQRKTELDNVICNGVLMGRSNSKPSVN